MTDSLAIGEIARRVRFPDEDLLAVRDRLRGYVKEGLLQPEGQGRREAGQHRRFSEKALVHAAILSQLARHNGAWATKVQVASSGALDKAMQQLPKVSAATEQGKEICLLVWAEELNRGFRVVSKIPAPFIDTTESRSVKAGLPKRFIEMPPFFDDVLIINLTRLFARIRVPLKDFAELERLSKMFAGIERIERA
jgi:DNA-binding transcriptional MerR regulator